jgi:hypothetical protein
MEEYENNALIIDLYNAIIIPFVNAKLEYYDYDIATNLNVNDFIDWITEYNQ